MNVGVVILALWEAFTVTFQFTLLNGGLASMINGSIIAGLGCCAVGLSLAALTEFPAIQVTLLETVII
jgi:choline transport protein